MKCLKYITLFFFGLLLGSSQIYAQNARAENTEQATGVFQQLENDFTNPRLSSKSIQAFELRGIQKIQDFTDYIALISDPTLNDNFKDRSLQAALKLFVHDSVQIQVMNWKTKLPQAISIQDFLKNLKENKTEKIVWTFSNPTTPITAKPLRLAAYHWKSKGQMTQQFGQQKSENQVTFNITLQKIEKKFGAQSKIIWEVFIGSME